ncbi:ATP-binding domain-containing protein, partial [Pseudomonadales bacterium]|nr:ATP-binding domain-containing protein [Pseudomonadales bacterium]
EALRSDPYFNALRLKFGYAITCHKAQGSEWNHVFVKCKTHQSQLCADYFRWLYTAITRTASNLYLLDEPHIKLGASPRRISNPGVIENNERPEIPEVFTDEVSPPPMSFGGGAKNTGSEGEAFGIPVSNGFLMGLLGEVKYSIASTDIVIYEVQHQQYQEAYIFTCGEESSRVNISYNGKQKIVAITLPIPSDLGGRLLDLLAPLKGRVIAGIVEPNQSSTIIFDEPFLEEYYQRIEPVAKERNIFISDVEQLQYRQRYYFKGDKDSAVVDISYKKNKQISSYEPIRNLCTSKEFLNEVLLIIDEL